MSDKEKKTVEEDVGKLYTEFESELLSMLYKAQTMESPGREVGLDNGFREYAGEILAELTAFFADTIGDYYQARYEEAHELLPEDSVPVARFRGFHDQRPLRQYEYEEFLRYNINGLCEALISVINGVYAVVDPETSVKMLLEESERRVRRKLETETVYAETQAALDVCKVYGIDEYTFVAEIDEKTTPGCSALNGQRFYVHEAEEGKNLPPMHRNCRSYIMPYIKTEADGNELQKSAVALRNLDTGVFGGIDGKNGKNYYGGNQAWYSEEWKRDGGCGPVAAANIMAYLAQQDPERYGALYSPSTIHTILEEITYNASNSNDLTQSLFTNHMNHLLKYVTPGRLPFGLTPLFSGGVESIGYWHADAFVRDVKKYASDMGVELTGYWMIKDNMASKWNQRTVDEAAAFIEAGLGKDSPVAMIIHSNSYAKDVNTKDFTMHWVTITGIGKNANGDHEIKVSSWGDPYDLNLNSIWSNGGYIGLAYFE